MQNLESLQYNATLAITTAVAQWLRVSNIFQQLQALGVVHQLTGFTKNLGGKR